MAAREGGSPGNTLLAFAIGAAVGAVVALLYAPASGDETRRKIRRTVRDQKDNLDAAVERGREVFEQARRAPFDRSGKETL